jgi:glucose-1-phosphate cytidylyltransferase
MQKADSKNEVRKNDDFIVTYGDAVSDINISELVNFHKKNKKIGTITSVKPPARFGELILKGKYVKSFKEKPQMQKGWINGGFFIFSSKIFKFINKSSTILEKYPI